MKENSINFKRILIFLIIAISVSNMFRFDVFHIQDNLEKLPTWMFIFFSVLLEGSGVFIGALIAIYLLRKKKKTEISFYGTSKYIALLMAIIPIVLLTFFGVKNEYGIHPRLYGLLAIGGSLIYCIMEEFGWRGYLQEEFKGLKPMVRYAIIGTIWYVWHLSFLTNISLVENLTFLGTLIFASWGIGQVAEATKSILASTCFHLIINVVSFNMLFKNGIDTNQKLIIVGISILLWIVLLRRWKKENEGNIKPEQLKD